MTINGRDQVAARLEPLDTGGFVSTANACFIGGPTGRNVDNISSCIGVQSECFNSSQWQIALRFNSQIWEIISAIFDQASRDALDKVDGDGKTDARINRIACRLVNVICADRLIDTHHFPRHIEQWTARVAGVDGGIGLNDISVAEESASR